MVSWRSNIHEIILAAALLIFIVLKIPHLHLPLHWDEMGVYGKSVIYLINHGISLLPGDLDPELSRGHPMFFVFIVASFVHIFGGSVAVYGHLAALIISLATAIATFELGRKLSGKTTGLVAALGLLLQPVFIAQSNLMLPEVMLTLFTLLSILYFLRKQWIGYFMWCSLALLTKETAIVILSSTALYSLLFAVRPKYKYVLIAIAPIVTFLLFLVIQRIQNGWFLFPYHTSLINLSAQYIYDNTINFFTFLFLAQGRIAITSVTVVALGLILWQKKATIEPAVILIILLLISMFSFSVINFYMNRYFMMLIPLFLIFSVHHILKVKFDLLKYVFLISLGVPMLYLRNPAQFNYDVDLGYIDQTVNLKNAVNYLEEHTLPKHVIACDFPMNFALEDSAYGYLESSDSLATTARWDSDWHYLTQTHPSSYELYVKDSAKVVLLNTIKDRFAKSRIYKISDR